jgi:signal peptidase I
METIVIQDNGMAPTLVYGDEVLIWLGAQADMSDVMVCEHPARDGALVIGRALAFAGHSIQTDENGRLYVDKDMATSQAEGHARFYDVTRKKLWDMHMPRMDYFERHDHLYFLEVGDELRVPEYHVEKGVYLLGDNRSETQFDSRAFGEVRPERCLGQVFMRLRPAPTESGDDLNHGYLDVIE